MKLAHIFTAAACTLAHMTLSAHAAAPDCLTDSECAKYHWNETQSAFACGQASPLGCKCTATTYAKCYDPCSYYRTNTTLCDNSKTTWNKPWHDAPYEQFIWKICQAVPATEQPGAYGLCKIYNRPEYKCTTGYYGQSTYDDTPTCTKCPSDGTATGTNSGAGHNLITSCYIPAGNYQDDTGEYELTDKCQYKE